MPTKEYIQQEVENTLQSIEGINRAEANPFLFTRIKARMQRQNGWDRLTSFITKPLFVIAVLVFVMAVNGWAFFGNGEDANAAQGNENIANTDIADEYNIVANTNYDFENTNNE